MSALTPQEQFQALNVLELLSDLFTAAQKNQFTREDILVIINCVRNDDEIFDPDIVIAQQIATAQQG